VKRRARRHGEEQKVRNGEKGGGVGALSERGGKEGGGGGREREREREDGGGPALLGASPHYPNFPFLSRQAQNN
jgi:hypothetical protein